VGELTVAPAPDTPTLTLAEAVEIALTQNFSLLGAVDALSAARFRYGAAKAEFFPSLTPAYERSENGSAYSLAARQRLPWLGGSLTATTTVRTLDDAPIPESRSADLRLVLSQPLLRGFGPNATFFALRNSRRAEQAQERSFELARQQLAVDVARAFYQVVQQRMLLAVAGQSLERTRNLLRASEARLKVGLVSKLDVFRAQLQASQAEEAMVRSQAALQDALERFRFLLGFPPDADFEPEAVDLSQIVNDELEPLEALMARARERRLDLQEVRDQVGDAQRAASLASQNLLPQIDLNLGVTRTGIGSSFGNAWNAGDNRVDVFLSGSYPLQRAQDLAQKRVADLDVAARIRSLRQRELEIESEVRAAVRDLQQIRQSVALQQTGVDVAAQQHRLATLRYQRGLASNFDVVDAEGSLVLARSALVGLLTRYRVARIDLLRVTGSLEVEREFAP
jgi:outer membrane protein TolC